MTDDLIFVCLILILIQEILRTGKCDLVDILVYLFLGHTKSVIGKGNGLLVWVYRYLDLVLEILRLFVLTHQLQFL